MTSPKKRVAIEGAGITGPVAALALAKAGYEVNVFETRQQNDVWSAGVLRITQDAIDALRAVGLICPIIVTTPGDDYRITVTGSSTWETEAYQYPEGFHNVVWSELHDSAVRTAREAGARFHWATSLPEGEEWDFVVHSAGVGYTMHKVKADHQSVTRLGYSAFRANSSIAAPAPWTAIKDMKNFIFNLAETRQGFTHFILYMREDSRTPARTLNLADGQPRLRAVYEQASELIPEYFRRYLDPQRLITPIQVSPLSFWSMPPLVSWNGGDYGDFGVHVDAGDAITPVSPHTGMGANLGIEEALRLPEAFASDQGLKEWIITTRSRRHYFNEQGLDRIRNWMSVTHV